MLFVSFWHLGLENIPEGRFMHRRVSAEVAKQLGALRLRGRGDDAGARQRSGALSSIHEWACAYPRVIFQRIATIRRTTTSARSASRVET